MKDLPSGPFTQNQCVLIGDVTASCTLTFTKATGKNTATFTVVPVNATFNDGTLTTKKGETLRYEVDSYGGLSAG